MTYWYKINILFQNLIPIKISIEDYIYLTLIVLHRWIFSNKIIKKNINNINIKNINIKII